MLRLASITLALALGLAPNVLSASDAIRVVDVTAGAGDTGVEVPIFGTHDQDIQGLSLALSYPTEDLDATSVSIAGSAVAAASPGGVPEFMSFIIDDAVDAFTGEIVGGIIFDLDPVAPTSIPASPTTEQLLATVSFDIDPDALPAVHAIELTNGIGAPPVDNAYSTQGATTLPTVESGTLTVENLFTFRMNDLTIPAGATTDILVRADHPLAINGFVVCVTYDNSQLFVEDYGAYTDWYEGLDAWALLQPSEIEFFFPSVVRDIEPGIDWVGVAANFDASGPFLGQEVPAGLNHSLVRFTVTVDGSLDEDEVVELLFTDGTGDPTPLSNILVVQDGASVTPNFDHAEITVGASSGFKRGDGNGDSTVNVADAVYLIQYIFVSGAPPGCFLAADVNDTGNIDISDVIYLLQYIFNDGPLPPAPGPMSCGPDATPDGLTCAIYLGC